MSLSRCHSVCCQNRYSCSFLR